MLPLALIALMLAPNTRPLLVFAPTSKDPRYLEQKTIAESNPHALTDRQVTLIPFLADSPNTNDQTRIRHKYHIKPSDFTVILLGKDGGEKLRLHTPITIEKLTTTIDAMPMRQEEIRSKK